MGAWQANSEGINKNKWNVPTNFRFFKTKGIPPLPLQFMFIVLIFMDMVVYPPPPQNDHMSSKLPQNNAKSSLTPPPPP